jgi:hypothetical protein
MGVMANNIPNPPMQSQPQLYHLQCYYWHHHATSTVMLIVVLQSVWDYIGNLERKKPSLSSFPHDTVLSIFRANQHFFLPKKAL